MPCCLGILFRMIHRKTLRLVVSRLHLIFYPKPRSSCPMKLEVYMYSCISKSRCVTVCVYSLYISISSTRPSLQITPNNPFWNIKSKIFQGKNIYQLRSKKKPSKSWNSPSSAKPPGTSLECRRLALDQVGGVVVMPRWPIDWTLPKHCNIWQVKETFFPSWKLNRICLPLFCQPPTDRHVEKLKFQRFIYTNHGSGRYPKKLFKSLTVTVGYRSTCKLTRNEGEPKIVYGRCQNKQVMLVSLVWSTKMLLGLGVQSAVTCCRLYDVHSIEGSSIVSKSDCLISSVKVSTPYQHSSIHPILCNVAVNKIWLKIFCPAWRITILRVPLFDFEGRVVSTKIRSWVFFHLEGFLLMECYSRFYPTCHGWSTYPP